MSKIVFLFLIVFTLTAEAKKKNPLFDVSPGPSFSPEPTFSPEPSFSPFPSFNPSPTPTMTASPTATPTPTPNKGYCVVDAENRGGIWFIDAVDCSVTGCPAVTFKCSTKIDPNPNGCDCPCDGQQIDCDRVGDMELMELRYQRQQETNQLNQKQINNLRRRVKALERR